jgi:hypothetical protein
LEKERAKHQEEKDAEREGIWSDPGFSATHKTVMSILELLAMALRDQDAAGLRYMYEVRRQREQEYLEDYRQQQQVQMQMQMQQQSGSGGGGGGGGGSGSGENTPTTPKTPTPKSGFFNESPSSSSSSNKRGSKRGSIAAMVRSSSVVGEDAIATKTPPLSPKKFPSPPSPSTSLSHSTAVLPPPSNDPHSEFFVAKLEVLEEIAEQAIHVHRARTKGTTTAFSAQSLAGPPLSSADALESLMNDG